MTLRSEFEITDGWMVADDGRNTERTRQIAGQLIAKGYMIGRTLPAHKTSELY